MVVQVERSAHFEGPCRVSGALEGLGYQHNSAVIHRVRANNLSFCCVVPWLGPCHSCCSRECQICVFSVRHGFHVYSQVILRLCSLQ